ncbi:MAG: hypothetical protein ACTSPS_01540 [Promethearchaeota archaeon]
MRLEKKIEIKSSVSKIYEVVRDEDVVSLWNPSVDSVSQPSEDKFLLKTSVGDLNIVSWETVENERATWTLDMSNLNQIGYVLKSMGEMVEVTLWLDFDNKKHKKGYVKVGELVLNGLKRYVEFLEEGGDPKEYDKKAILVSP